MNLLNLKGRLSFDVHFAGAWSRDINESIFNKLISNFNLTKNIKYHGPLYNKEKEKVFQSADIFILPTKNECFPLVLLEAMSYGLPIITTFEGAIPEIIEDGVNGLLVEQGNVEQLAEKIEFVSNNTNLRVKMMNSNFSKFNNEYKFTNFEENFWNVINSIYSGDLT